MMSAAVCGLFRRHVAIKTSPRILGASKLNDLVENRTCESNFLSISTRSFASAREEKLALKQKRRELYETSRKRMQKLQTRRNDRDVGTRKHQFREWFDKRRIFQEIMDRKARQFKLDWTIQAAAILERLPVVTPDVPQWEIDYYNLKAYLEQFGKEYPDELGFSPGKGPVHMTEEEILGALLQHVLGIFTVYCLWTNIFFIDFLFVSKKCCQKDLLPRLV